MANVAEDAIVQERAADPEAVIKAKTSTSKSESFSSKAAFIRQRSQEARRCVVGFGRSPLQLAAFLRMLHAKFGGYVCMAVLQYGVNQGAGMPLLSMARRYYFADTLHVDGATMGRLTWVAHIPWEIKPVVGILSDAYPLLGFHKTSYLVLTAFLGLVAYLSLGTLPLAAVATVPFFIMINLSISVPDVMVDATTAQLSKEQPEHASDLQSLCWGALAVGGFLAAASSGLLVEWMGAQRLFTLISLCSLSILVPGVLRWLPDKRVPREQWRFHSEFLKRHTPITILALYMTFAAVGLSVSQLFLHRPRDRGAATLACGVLLAFGVFFALRRVTPMLAKTAIFIFLRECMQPGIGDAMFMWLKEYPEGPMFTPKVMGFIDCFGSLGLLLGVTLYNKYFTDTSYRKIFLISQLAMVFINLFDFVLVKRWNRDILGIPDIVFVLGDDAFSTVMSRFFAMPMFVLAAKVCPDNVEATLFALLMALSNFGSAIGQFFGVALLEAFGVVGGNFDHLPEAVIAKSLCRLLPIPLIFILVPNITPNDPIKTETEAPDENAQARYTVGETPDENAQAGYTVGENSARSMDLRHAAPPPHSASEADFANCGASGEGERHAAADENPDNRC